jgi:folate-binding protein YgfZ
MTLHEFHQAAGARFSSVNGREVVADYGDLLAEHAALWETAGVLDLSFRSRVCLTGADRVRFLHGQVTNDVNRLHPGEGCYAALITAKGRMQSDLNLYCLADELLLDFEPGLTEMISQRLERYIVADDVQVVDASPHYGVLSVQGPRAEAIVLGIGITSDLPQTPSAFIKISDSTLGEIYLMNQPRLNTRGFDLFVPFTTVEAAARKLLAAAKSANARGCGWTAFETARIEAAIPRFGVDMDESNIPIECGIETRAISYTKGCYIGQEVINRIHTLGHVNRELRGFRLAGDLKTLPAKGDKFFHAGKEVGYITSAIASPKLKANIGLGYARKEVHQIGTELTLRSKEGDTAARIVELPFIG